LIFREVVGLMAEILAQRGNFLAGLIFDHDSISGRSGVPARAAVTMCDQVMLGWTFMRFE